MTLKIGGNRSIKLQNDAVIFLLLLSSTIFLHDIRVHKIKYKRKPNIQAIFYRHRESCCCCCFIKCRQSNNTGFKNASFFVESPNITYPFFKLQISQGKIL